MTAADFPESTHGSLGCITCHGGQNLPEADQAHQGMKKDPSAETGGVCASCHTSYARRYSTSLHLNLNGMRNAIQTFAHPGVLEEDGGLTTVFNGNCNNCHATCGQCHVSRASTVQGGLLAQHEIQAKPSATDVCYSCHGQRNAGEYLGLVGLNEDVHRTQGLDCMDCHPDANVHGTGRADREMYAVENLPECVTCHPDAVSNTSQNLSHTAHPAGTLACSVCHSMPAQNCNSCHVAISPAGKVSSHSEMSLVFKIGLNLNPDAQHPEKYVVLRHVPTVADTFDAAGENLVPNYDRVPNWKLSSTHNSQRITPQNESCNACHGNAALFLQESDLKPTDSKANWDLLVPAVPEPLAQDPLKP